MDDPILESFLAAQLDEGARLARESDLLELEPVGPAPNRVYRARFRCRTIVWRDRDARVVEGFEIGVRFGADHLRRVEAAQSLAWLEPRDAWHPNVRHPWICPGRFTVGISLVEILFQCHAIGTWNKVTSSEHDSLQPAACSWARAHRDRYPVDDRPLRRRAGPLTFSSVAAP